MKDIMLPANSVEVTNPRINAEGKFECTLCVTVGNRKPYRYNEIDVESMTSVDEDAWTVDG